MKKFKQAFTMIEIVFVIVILGILASIAIPRLSATRTDAQITKIRSDISAIRSAIISERQGRLIKGESSYISSLDQGVASNTDGVALFDGNDSSHLLLSYPIYATSPIADGKWLKTGNNQYSVKVDGSTTVFTYTPSPRGIFDCDHTVASCNSLMK